jgi:hypothetical protein
MTTDGDPRLSELIRVYDDALDERTCGSVIDLFESDTEGQFRRGRQNTWVEYIMTGRADEACRELERVFVQGMRAALEDYVRMPQARVLGMKAARAFEHLKIKKYRSDVPRPDHFPLHVDAYDHKTAVRMVAFLWYLNTVDEGGETVFPVLGRRVAPRAGRLVVFPPMWMFEHHGEPPVSGHKYILTSYLNVRDPEDAYRFSYPAR